MSVLARVSFQPPPSSRGGWRQESSGTPSGSSQFQLPPSSRGGWRFTIDADTSTQTMFQLPPSSRGGWRRSMHANAQIDLSFQLPPSSRGGWRSSPGASGCAMSSFNSRHPHEEDGACQRERTHGVVMVSAPAILTRRMAPLRRLERRMARLFQLPPSSRGGWRVALPVSPINQGDCFNSRHPHEEDGAATAWQLRPCGLAFQLPPSSRGGWRRWRSAFRR